MMMDSCIFCTILEDSVLHALLMITKYVISIFKVKSVNIVQIFMKQDYFVRTLYMYFSHENLTNNNKPMHTSLIIPLIKNLKQNVSSFI